MAEATDSRPAAARAFVRSLNILLKFARMYDFGHPRTSKQYETAWGELRSAIGSENGSGLLLAASGEQLLLDGIPLDSSAAERSFAKMLSSAGIASIHFGPQINQNSLARLVRGFPTNSTSNSKPAQLAEQLKAALGGDPHIHVNEVCFVPADSAVAKSTVAAQLAARTLGLNSEATNAIFDDPEKLLQLIIAAEGTQGSGSGPKVGGLGGNGDGDGDGNGGSGGYGSGGSGSGSGYGFDRSGSGRGNGSESAGGEGRHDGTGNGSDGGGSGSGSGDGRGGNGSGAGYYASEPSDVVRGVVASHSEAGEGADGLRMSGPVSSVHGSEGGTGQGASSSSGTWNIVGGDGAGTPLEPDAGGFWLNKDGAKQSATDGPGSGARISGGAPINGANFSSESRSSDFGTWNIVGGSEEGTPLDPNAGGFWLNKENSKGSGSTPRGVGGEVSVTDSQGSTGSTRNTTSGGTGSGPNVSGRGSGGSGRGGGHSSSPSGSAGTAATGHNTGGNRGGGTRNPGGPGGQSWKVPGAGGSETVEASRWGNATAGIRGSRTA